MTFKRYDDSKGFYLRLGRWLWISVNSSVYGFNFEFGRSGRWFGFHVWDKV